MPQDGIDAKSVGRLGELFAVLRTFWPVFVAIFVLGGFYMTFKLSMTDVDGVKKKVGEHEVKITKLETKFDMFAVQQERIEDKLDRVISRLNR